MSETGKITRKKVEEGISTSSMSDIFEKRLITPASYFTAHRNSCSRYGDIVVVWLAVVRTSFLRERVSRSRRLRYIFRYSCELTQSRYALSAHMRVPARKHRPARVQREFIALHAPRSAPTLPPRILSRVYAHRHGVPWSVSIHSTTKGYVILITRHPTFTIGHCNGATVTSLRSSCTVAPQITPWNVTIDGLSSRALRNVSKIGSIENVPQSTSSFREMRFRDRKYTRKQLHHNRGGYIKQLRDNQGNSEDKCNCTSKRATPRTKEHCSEIISGINGMTARNVATFPRCYGKYE